MPDIGVTDFARVLRRAAIHLAVADDAGADAVADLHEDHVLWHRRRIERPLASSHRVDVVVDELRAVEMRAPELA
jgi:hypothetical protein